MGRNERDENVVFNAAPIFNGSSTTSNGTNTVTISNVAPPGVGTATIGLWMQVFVGETVYYIPMWT